MKDWNKLQHSSLSDAFDVTKSVKVIDQRQKYQILENVKANMKTSDTQGLCYT